MIGVLYSGSLLFGGPVIRGFTVVIFKESCSVSKFFKQVVTNHKLEIFVKKVSCQCDHILYTNCIQIIFDT